jgi:hypothetical protein
MRITTTWALTLAGIAAAAIALASAANARAGRDSAIEKCMAYAQKNAGVSEAGARTALYKGCMTQSGYRP